MNKKQHLLTMYRFGMEGLVQRLLHQPEKLKPKFHSYHTVLMLHTSIPSFDDCESWAIFRDNKKNIIKVRKCCWSRGRGYRLLEECEELFLEHEECKPELVPIPVIDVKDADIEAVKWEVLASRAYKIKLPVVLPETNTQFFDGTTYTLKCQNWLSKTSLEWSSSLPEEWKELQEWAESLRRFCDEAVGDIYKDRDC